MKTLNFIDKTIFKTGNTLIFFFILSCIISRANLNYYFFDILSQLGFQIFIGGFFLIIILLFLKRFKAAIICFIINFIFLFDILYSCKNCNAIAEKHLKNNNNNLKILIFNIEYSNSIENFEKIRKTIILENPDIIQLAETSGRLSGEVKKLKKQYPHTLNLDKRKDIFDTVIFSKYPLKNKKDLTDNIVAATVVKNNKQFNLISVHFVPIANKLHTEIANRQMAAAIDYIKINKGDYILIGDLNMTMTSKRFTNFLNETNLYTYVSLVKPTSTWPAKMQLRFAPEYVLIENFPNVLGIQIDHVLYSSKFKLIDKKITNSYGSDHRGLIVNLTY
jgi:endonuclease/exonuclease/phosphatase (EEP) superfamily protein YafD